MGDKSKEFKYALGADVTISISGEEGTVVSRLDSENSEDQCQVRYKSADGRAVESWWVVSALEPTK